MNTQQYHQFRHAFVEEKMFNEHYQKVENPKVMEMILNVICMALCNKVPKGVVPFKMDQIIQKIRLLSIPRGVEIETREILNAEGEVTQVIEKNSNERALVRVMVPRRKLTLSEIDVEEKKRDADFKLKAAPLSPTSAAGEGEKKDEEGKEAKPEEEKPAEEAPAVEEEPLEDLKEKFIEQDQDDRVTQMNGRVNLNPPGYLVHHLNQFGARAHRHDFVSQILRVTYDFFVENVNAQKQIEEIADADAAKLDEKYVEENCSEYDFPVFDFYINAPDYD